MNNNSPLEQLAAFAICFALGAVSALALAIHAHFTRVSKEDDAAA